MGLLDPTQTQIQTEYTHLNGFIKYHVELLAKEVKSIENMVVRLLKTLGKGLPRGEFKQRLVLGEYAKHVSAMKQDESYRRYTYYFDFFGDEAVNLGIIFGHLPEGKIWLSPKWFYEYFKLKLSLFGEDVLLDEPARIHRILSDIRVQVRAIIDEFQPREITELKLQLLEKDEEIDELKKMVEKYEWHQKRLQSVIFRAKRLLLKTMSILKSKKIGDIREMLESAYRNHIGTFSDAYYEKHKLDADTEKE